MNKNKSYKETFVGETAAYPTTINTTIMYITAKPI